MCLPSVQVRVYGVSLKRERGRPAEGRKRLKSITPPSDGKSHPLTGRGNSPRIVAPRERLRKLPNRRALGDDDSREPRPDYEVSRRSVS